MCVCVCVYVCLYVRVCVCVCVTCNIMNFELHGYRTANVSLTVYSLLLIFVSCHESPF